MKYCAVVLFQNVRSAIVYGPFDPRDEEHILYHLRQRHPDAVVTWTTMRPRIDS